MFKESENGQTHFCSECERLSRENEQLKAELQDRDRKARELKEMVKNGESLEVMRNLFLSIVEEIESEE